MMSHIFEGTNCFVTYICTHEQKKTRELFKNMRNFDRLRPVVQMFYFTKS